ncbi:uracil-DNA glycosylase family protein [Athalassotoga sp.]|uniref:uracil-DNA glycosylase family protein n=1 Tax=Athalassotoga sp. TaxID=2022597 RepID=UPI003D047CCF
MKPFLSPALTKDGVRYLKKDGTYSPAVRFWTSIKGIAKEIIENAIPGTDYAITEVVHCKSQHEHGVKEALCPQKYLSSVISLSPAKIIIVLGSTAKDIFNSYYKIKVDEKQKVFGPGEIENVKRYIVFLPHPNAFAHAHKLSNNFSLDKLSEIRHFVNSEEVF